MSKLKFLTGDAPAEALVVSPVEPQAEAQAPDAVREAAAPEAGPALAGLRPDRPAPTTAVPVTPPIVEPGFVPIASMLDEREKRQALERQVAALKAKENPPEPQTSDEAFQAALYAQNLKVSRKFADRQYGAELTATVHDWAVAKCDADPIFNQQIRSSEDPYEVSMQAFNRDQIVAKVTPDRLAAFEAWEAAQAGAPATPNPSHPPASPPAPRSLVNAPGNGAQGRESVPAGEGNAYGSVFPT